MTKSTTPIEDALDRYTNIRRLELYTRGYNERAARGEVPNSTETMKTINATFGEDAVTQVRRARIAALAAKAEREDS